MNALAAQQQAMLAALWAPQPQDALAALGAAVVQDAQAARGLGAYRSNGRELALRALQAAYPVVSALLGEENFAPLARAHWQRTPPRRGDMAHWGGELPAHIESLADLQAQEPYLADVARLEWALHCLASAPDARLDAASFGLLTQREPAQLTLLLAPGTRVLASAWPAASIVRAHLEGEPSLLEAGRLLRERVAQTALAWRCGLKPSVRAIPAAEATFITALQENRSLADSLQAAPELDFNEWLAPAVQCGLVTGARPL